MTVEAHISEWLARPPSLFLWRERFIPLHRAPSLWFRPREMFHLGLQNTFPRSISFSMYNTLDSLIRKVDYFSSLKEGYKMTILWPADRSPLVTGQCAIAPNLNRIRTHSGWGEGCRWRGIESPGQRLIAKLIAVPHTPKGQCSFSRMRKDWNADVD